MVEMVGLERGARRRAGRAIADAGERAPRGRRASGRARCPGRRRPSPGPRRRASRPAGANRPARRGPSQSRRPATRWRPSCQRRPPHRPPDDPDAGADEEKRPELAPVEVWAGRGRASGSRRTSHRRRAGSGPGSSTRSGRGRPGGGRQAGVGRRSAAAWRSGVGRPAVGRVGGAAGVGVAVRHLVRRRRLLVVGRGTGRRSSSGLHRTSLPHRRRRHRMSRAARRIRASPSGRTRRDDDGGDAWRTAGIRRRSGCSAGRASTRCSRTCARSRSTRHTGRRRIRSSSPTVGDRRVAFLPRHGRRHTIPPHKINYRANVWAMRSLGVKAVISPCAAGSLQPHVKPGDFVVCDQFVDRTNGRADTFFDGPIVTHLSSAEIYDPVLRELAIETIRDHGIAVHETRHDRRSSRARASRPRPSRSGSATPAGRSST